MSYFFKKEKFRVETAGQMVVWSRQKLNAMQPALEIANWI